MVPAICWSPSPTGPTPRLLPLAWRASARLLRSFPRREFGGSLLPTPPTRGTARWLGLGSESPSGRSHTSDELPTQSAGVDPEGVTDPLFAPIYQWGLFSTTWTPALIGVGPRPRIAISDSGIDRTHEEWSGTPSPLVDPYDAYGDRIGPNEANDWGAEGHGTHVAGIAAAPTDNGVGMIGVAPAEAGVSEVIPVRIADRIGDSTDETMVASGGRCTMLAR